MNIAEELICGKVQILEGGGLQHGQAGHGGHVIEGHAGHGAGHDREKLGLLYEVLKLKLPICMRYVLYY